MILSKDDFLSRFKKSKTKEVTFADGHKEYVRSMGLKEREQFEKLYDDDKDETLRRATLLAFTVCDEVGGRLFDEKDIPALAECAAPELVILWQEAFEFNCLGAKQLDALKKTSASADSAGSSSTSASPSE